MDRHLIELKVYFNYESSRFLCILDMKQFDTNSRSLLLISGLVMLFWCYLLANVSALGSWSFFFLFFFSGKPPAGPVCGITPQDPSRAGSQKRNSCQTMNYCSVTRQVRFWGVDEEAGSTSRIAHTRSHTHSLTCIYIHRFVFILGHIHKLMRSHTQRSKN